MYVYIRRWCGQVRRLCLTEAISVVAVAPQKSLATYLSEATNEKQIKKSSTQLTGKEKEILI